MRKVATLRLPRSSQQVSLAIALQSAPVFFRRKGRGRFQRAPLEQLQAGLAALERKQKELEQQTVWQQELVAGVFPETLQSQAKQLLFSPDKNTSAYKALIAACTQTGESPAQLMIRCGAISSALDYHQGMFLKAHFPNGGAHNESHVVDTNTYDAVVAELPLAKVSAFSIDDSGTTEIDDALSVTALSDGIHRIGVHIAAPGLVINRDDPLDQLARSLWMRVSLAQPYRFMWILMHKVRFLKVHSRCVPSWYRLEPTCASITLKIRLAKLAWGMSQATIPIAKNWRSCGALQNICTHSVKKNGLPMVCVRSNWE